MTALAPRPLVSVVIPTYNRLDELCELVESLARQSYDPLQIIIVNDGGEPVDVVRELYPELDLTVVSMKQNGGQVRARNRGLDFARGELVMLCDDDDLLLPEHTERMVRAFTDCDLAYCDAEIFHYVVDAQARRATDRFVFAFTHDPPAMRRFSTFIPVGCMFRPELHRRLGGFDPEMGHYWDWDFFLRASACATVRRVPVASALYAFGATGQNLSNDPGVMRRYLDKLCAKHGLGELPALNFFLLLEQPEVKARRADTERLWDGAPFVSRRHRSAP